MLKRFVVATFISALAVVGVAPAASAATTNHHSTGYTVAHSIDWD